MNYDVVFVCSSGRQEVEGLARAWRIQYEGAYYHALSRGNERRDIFMDDGDRKVFLATLGEATERPITEGRRSSLHPDDIHPETTSQALQDQFRSLYRFQKR